MGPGGLLAAARAERPPGVGEVAIEVHAVGVAARAGCYAVRVEVGDDPQIRAGPEGSTGERMSHRDPGCLVAVDTADDERDPGGVSAAQLDGVDRAPQD